MEWTLFLFNQITSQLRQVDNYRVLLVALFFSWFVWTMLINHLSPLVGQFNQQYFFVYSRKCFQKEGFSSILVDILCNKRTILINNFSWRKTWNIKIVFKALKALNFPIPLWKSLPWWQSQPKFSTWRLRFYDQRSRSKFFPCFGTS